MDAVLVAGYFGQDNEIPKVVLILDATAAEVEEYMHDYTDDRQKYIAKGFWSPTPVEWLSWLRGRFEVIELPLVLWDPYNGPSQFTQVWQVRNQ